MMNFTHYILLCCMTAVVTDNDGGFPIYIHVVMHVSLHGRMPFHIE
jgi:hypothetical protein